jgi:4-diphosphocytidyl-2-C-methyl-D-erythritol kinase
MAQDRPAMTVTRDAWAKINLTLRITGRRPDGYHEVDSLIAFARVGDRLAMEPAADFRLTVQGPFARYLSDHDDNLALRAARAFAAFAAVDGGVQLRLTKNLPVAAGIGGGSADAAAVISGLRELWNWNGPSDDLLPLAVDLGADVAVCLAGRPCLATGIGEILVPVHGLPPLWALLVNPGQPLATAAVFAARQGRFSEATGGPPPAGGLGEWIAWLAAAGNDLEPAACGLLPVVDQVLDAIRATKGCLISRMSGSGATCFGLYDSQEAAEHAARHIRAAERKWWVRPAALIA